jgi:hypothetical protein
MMNRRSFLAAAAAAAFASATLLRAAEGKRRVVVVGAGLAGLSCTYELRKLGNNVPAEVFFSNGLAKYIVCYQPKKESLS